MFQDFDSDFPGCPSWLGSGKSTGFATWRQMISAGLHHRVPDLGSRQQLEPACSHGHVVQWTFRSGKWPIDLFGSPSWTWSLYLLSVQDRWTFSGASLYPKTAVSPWPMSFWVPQLQDQYWCHHPSCVRRTNANWEYTINPAGTAQVKRWKSVYILWTTWIFQ